ncbi:MAG: UDP-N-acetylglucosamine 1-carboxyvinyltransferase [Actinomycetota bacterium]|nr:UDP-N-acetylglucosamine 1-carboxyvinyltransferase [Actinomycetota bacterium]
MEPAPPTPPVTGPDGAAFVVSPGPPLSGTVRAGGAKNSVLKLMAACLLAEGRFVLSNVPDITDVAIMAEVLRAMGVSVERRGRHQLVIDTPADLVPEAPYALVEKMRASIVVLGPLLARVGRATVSMPGGDDFGHRPIDMHLGALGAMGATFTAAHGDVEGTVVPTVAGRPRLVGTRVVLDYPSHTATDNVLMAAVLAKGTTVVENAAREPEVRDLADFLCAMGARIRGAGTATIEIEGVEALHPADHVVIPDRVVAATYLVAAGLAGGEVVVEDARPDHMEMLVTKLASTGLSVELVPDGLRAARDPGARPAAVDVATLPYPGVATDYKPLLVTLLTVADGVGIVTENLFSGRFRYVDELRRMGADIRTEGHHAVVRGVPHLSGAPVRAPDIRAGAALVLAGLVADGETVVAGAAHVDRGYEGFAERLAALGAAVRRTA